MKLMSRIYNNKNFMSEASHIMNHKEFVKTKSIIHHKDTRFNHSVRVAYLSYLTSKILGCDEKASIRGGLLHDFFLERDDRSIISETKMLVEHPTIAKENAINYFGVNAKEQNIIEAHMFPISTTIPRSKEAWIVSMCDKLVAFGETLTAVKVQATLWLLILLNIIK